jgi:predicted naringenin-chalcone synthase
MLYLSHFSVIRPEHEYSQERALLWIAKAHTMSAHGDLAEENIDEFHEQLLRKLMVLGVGPNKIEKRGTMLADFTHENFPNMHIYRIDKDNQQGQDLKVRSDFFEKSADTLFDQFYENTPLADHLLQVTCTGYVFPSAAQKLVSRKQDYDTVVTNVFHMGCYASIPAIRIAGGMILENETADIVHTEMCSLHMNPALHDIEQLVVQTLFADGFVKYTVSKEKQTGFEVIAMQELIIPESIESMSWRQESWGMKMHISKHVPTLIKQQLKSYIQMLFHKASLPVQEAYYAIHPGGPKIIDEVAKELQLPAYAIQHSAHILKQCGNMSSATLPHVWDAMLKDSTVPDGALVVSLAFGPGLTVAGSIMRKVI